MKETLITHLSRLHEEERKILEIIDNTVSPMRRVQMEELLRIVQEEMTELLARNTDVAGTA